MNADVAELLVRENYITQEALDAAKKYAATHAVDPLDYLKSENLVTADIVGQAMAEHYGVPYFNLGNHEIPKEYIKMIPEELASQHRVVVVGVSGEAVKVVTDQPRQPELQEVLSGLFAGKPYRLVYSNSEDVDQYLSRHRKPLATRFSKLLTQKERVAPGLLEEIFEDSLSFKASDIHFEPRLEDVIIRFRVDGVLQEAGRLPKEFYENILNRIKVQSGLRIDEHFSAQDGALRYEKDGRIVDMRTSIAPTVEGEKVVLRTLSVYIRSLALIDLGLTPVHQKLLQTLAAKPFGMILVVGPTGSGKTTTLYALIKLLNNPDVNITSIEDPVEYRMRGINQIQVNAVANITFAKGLRSIIRQDPDIILVGEIRDQETVEIAINAALTGQLLLSTFHSNDAATAIPRLIDMGVEPFLLASTMEAVVAQRLVRKLCAHCRHSVAKRRSDFDTPQLRSALAYFPEESTTLYEGKGCELCGFTGYSGRTAIFEILVVTPAMQELILSRPSKQLIWRLARQEGAESLFEDGIAKVKRGITSLDELLRVAEPPQSIRANHGG